LNLPPWITLQGEGIIVAVKAVPRASRTRAVGEHDGLLRIQIAAAPHHGQSNAALCGYLADAAGVRATQARVRRGSGGARKLIEIDGDPDTLAATLMRTVAATVGS
jgi:uncharacterized protein YggU (UPF0235/DUF167 family)